ncbi:MAG: alpha-1,4-glucan--maltose-1-phosphate maltosyltransferase [Gammaproteobacteria bacterium]
MTDTPSSIIIANVQPQLDCGRYPVKREVGDDLEVSADIVKEGHDVIAAVLKYREAGASVWHEAALQHFGNDQWRGRFPLTRNTRYVYTVEAWTDHFETWRHNISKCIAVRQDVALELREGRQLILDSIARVTEVQDRQLLQRAMAAFDATHDDTERTELLLGDNLRRAMARYADRSLGTTFGQELEVAADRVAARYAAWYEMFPRSQGSNPNASATFADCERRLPEIRNMGFDVIYLAPIHPIGVTHRKGPNNSAHAAPGDPGSPYAIGNQDGGHTAIHPALGTLEDFQRFVRRAAQLDMEVALDIALQCSPDHPYLKTNPEWFSYRPDGSIRYVENPPKKYQDIVSVDFNGPHWQAIWHEWRDVIFFWITQGIRTFRIDNPHTKPISFWAWLIREVQKVRPDVIFLAEAFTRPKLLHALAKAGFSQSYTYFTWRNFKHELIEYLTELTQGPDCDYLRPHFFTNTPDILPEFLQTGGRAAFQIRLVLAATLSSLYGIYNGFELCEARALPDSEEYLDSEKYQYKVWDWDRPGHIKDFITAINHIRRDNPALHELHNLRFYPADDDNVLFYGKGTLDGKNTVFIAVNLDPFEVHQATIEFPLAEMGLATDKAFQIEELLSGRKHLWRGARHRIELDPQTNPAMIFRLTRWTYREYVDTCF